jgi:predicted metal-dependent phosphoesterase TrpH
MIDLHTHTTASDGQHPPAQLVRRAFEAGVRTLAVTDHDTVAGLPEAAQAARELGVELIAGIELSTFVNGSETHLLGHFVDHRCGQLAGLSSMLRVEREKRMRAMVSRLCQLGLPCEMDEVTRVSGGENLGRPHLARVMMERGYVKDVREAFARYIGRDRPAFVERYKLSSQEAIGLIREAGGATTVAHAGASGLTPREIRKLKEQGAAGLEVNHPDHAEELRKELGTLARELDLVPTGGSDFHGELIVPGRRLGMMHMDPRDLERLRARAARLEA